LLTQVQQQVAQVHTAPAKLIAVFRAGEFADQLRADADGSAMRRPGLLPIPQVFEQKPK
jgi:hypothetical protein